MGRRWRPGKNFAVLPFVASRSFHLSLKAARVALQLFLLVLIQLPGSWQQQQPSSCSSGTTLASSPPSTLNAQHLANGALATSVLSVWDFQGQTGLLAATPGTTVALTCVVVTNATVSPPASTVFLQPMAIDLAHAAALAMSSVSLGTDCATVLAYQQYLCSSYRAAGSLTLEQGAVHFTHWQDGFTSLDNVTLTCPSPETAAQPPCRLAAVQTAAQLLEAFTTYAAAAAATATNVTIVVAANISIPRSGFWPETPVPVVTNITLLGSPLLQRPLLDLGLNVKMWDLLPPSTFHLVNLTPINLAPAYFSPGVIFSQFGMLSERVWAFRRYERLLHIINCTLVVPPEQLSYTKYWLTFLVSPVPEAQDKAAWIRVLGMKVAAVNASGVFYESAMAYTVFYSNVRITDTLDVGYALLPQNTGLSQLQAESVPLTSVNPAINASDFQLALLPNSSAPDEAGRRWVLLVANITLSEDEAPVAAGSRGDANTSSSDRGSSSVRLPGSTIVSRGPVWQTVRLSLGGRVDALSVIDGSTLTVRQLVLSGLANRSAVYAPKDPMAVLAGPLWGVGLAAGGSKVRLENCTVLISADELRLLQQCLLPPDAAQALPGGRAYDSGLVAAVQQFYITADTGLQIASYGPSYLIVGSGSTLRYEMFGVTFRTPVVPDGEVAEASFAALGVPDGASGGSKGGLEGWAIGVIAGCIVGGVLLLALAVVMVVVRRRRRAAGGQDAYAKYLRGSADAADQPPPAGPTGAVSYCVFPSQELTNSSQVLRPGARTSDIERATVGVSKASASGGIGAIGRSTSTTGGMSHDTSSAVAACSSGGPAAIRDGGEEAGKRGLHPPSPAAASAAAAATLGSDHGGQSQATDSFEQPPTASNLGQHGPSGRSVPRNTSMIGATASSGVPMSLTPSSTTDSAGAALASSALSTAGGAALDQMHAMIQVLGRDFNDKQLEVHSLLGKGAHGTVYRGKWRGLQVAVKSMIFNSESSARQQQRPLMEAAISSNLAHPNIVTTYSYELREVEHELAALSPELARQGGGWRLLIIQEYCDAGPLRRIVDCGFFLSPHKAPLVPQSRAKLKLPAMGLLRKDSPSRGAASESSTGAAGPSGSSRGSSGSSENGNGGRSSPVGDAAAAPHATGRAAGHGGNGGTHGLSGAQQGTLGPQLKPSLEDVPADVPPRPGSSLEAALRYVEAALMIARGLQHIHDKSIVHGDLNPNNVLLMRAPGSPLGFCLKVADFGLSVRMADGESHMSNLFQGSPYYCAPEVVLSGKVGKSADIFSLGIMLWEMQNGTRPPWRMGVRLRTFPSLNTGELEFGPETPPRYTRLTRDCFHASKDARPAIAAVVEALASIKQELGALPRA